MNVARQHNIRTVPDLLAHLDGCVRDAVAYAASPTCKNRERTIGYSLGVTRVRDIVANMIEFAEAEGHVLYLTREEQGILDRALARSMKIIARGRVENF